MKKKIISLITFMFIILITHSVNATNTGTVQLSQTNLELNPGDSSEVSVDVEDSEGLCSIVYDNIIVKDKNDVEYDKIELEIEYDEEYTLYENNGTFEYMFMGADKIFRDEKVLNINIKVKEDAEPGEYSICITGLKVYSCLEAGDDLTDIGEKSITVTVEEESEPEPPSDTTPPVGTITYNPNTATTGSVTATITFNEQNVTITNNNGKNTYVFNKNGEFTFEFKDAAENKGTATAKVTWIQQDVQGTTIPVKIKGADKGNIKFYLNEIKNENEIKDFITDKYLKAGNKIIAKVEIDGYLFAGIDGNGQEVKITENVDTRMYPALKIGEYYFTPLSAKREGNKTTLVYEFKNDDPKQEEVLKPEIKLDFTINNEGNPLFMYYSTNKNTFDTKDKLTNDNNSGVSCYINMHIDGIPYLTTKAYVEEKTESGRYDVGTPIMIEITSSEQLKDYTDPELRVSFSKTGLGKYNYQEDSTKGNAILYDIDTTEDGKTVWLYYYYIQEGDEGTLKVEYLSGEITDNADNIVDVTGKQLTENKVYADTLAPVVNISAHGIQNSVTNENRITYMLKFSEEVVGFTKEDIIVMGGTIESLSDVIDNEDGTYTYVLNVRVDTFHGNHGEVRVIIEQGVCKDLTGAENIRTESRITIDKKAPNLLSLEVQAEDKDKEKFKADDIIKVVAIFDENIERTSIIPVLQLAFSKSGTAKGTLTSTVEGNIITYTYTIAKEDEGEISVKNWNGKVLDLAGNETLVNKKNVSGNGIIADNKVPEANIELTTDEDKNVTAKISFNEENVVITNNDGKDTYLFTRNGEFTFEFEDEAGNKGTKKVVVTTIDKEAPVGRISLLINSDGTVTAKISFNEENVIITNNNGKDTYVFTKNGEFTFKFKDAAGNEGEETAIVDNMHNTEEQIPEIVFEELPVVQMGGIKYVKVSANMTTSAMIEKMDKASLYGVKPEFTNLTADGKLKTGTEIKLNGQTKYTVVVKGDVNGDGQITFLGDIIQANNCRIGVVKSDNLKILAADINNNGIIDFLSDIIAMNNYRLGIIDSL